MTSTLGRWRGRDTVVVCLVLGGLLVRWVVLENERAPVNDPSPTEGASADPCEDGFASHRWGPVFQPIDAQPLSKEEAAALLSAVEEPSRHDATSGDLQARLAAHGVVGAARGVVVDLVGRPIGGARAWILPEGMLLDAVGVRVKRRPRDMSYGWLDAVAVVPDGLTESFSDGAGRFAIAAPAFAKPSLLSATRTPQPSPLGEEWTGGAVLVVDAPGQALALDWLAPDGRFDRSEEQLHHVVLAPEAIVMGQVVDEDSCPIPDAVLKLVTSSRWRVRSEVPLPPTKIVVSLPAVHEVASDADGRFRLGRLPPSLEFGIEVRAPGFARRVLRVHALEVGEVLDLGKRVLQRGAPISGVVIGVDGAPVEGVAVSATPTDPRSLRLAAGEVMRAESGDDAAASELLREGWPEALRATTDARGRFTLHGAAAGEASREQTVSAVVAGCEPTFVPSVTPGREDVVLELRPAAHLLVRYVDDVTGEPIQPTKVTVSRRIGDDHYQNPRLARTRLPQGDLVLGVGPNGTVILIEFREGDWYYELVAGQEAGTVARATLRVPRSSSVAGRVVHADARRSPADRVWVARAGDDGLPLRAGGHASAYLADDGRFRIEQVRARDVLIVHTGGCHDHCPHLPLSLIQGTEHEVELECTAPPK